jgi:hypothetical protein
VDAQETTHRARRALSHRCGALLPGEAVGADGFICYPSGNEYAGCSPTFFASASGRDNLAWPLKVNYTLPSSESDTRKDIFFSVSWPMPRPANCDANAAACHRSNPYLFNQIVFPDHAPAAAERITGVPAGKNLWALLDDTHSEPILRHGAAALLNAANDHGLNYPVALVDVVVAIRRAFAEQGQRLADQATQFEELSSYGQDGRPGAHCFAAATPDPMALPHLQPQGSRLAGKTIKPTKMS